jgi:anaerobic selenocysteine-containing dehydrogenase
MTDTVTNDTRRQLRQVRGACPHDCPDRCSWVVTVDGDRAVGLRAADDHPFTAGFLCSKVKGYLTDRVHHPDRLLTALRRTGPKGDGRFAPVTLDEALDEVAERLSAVVARWGGEAILPYSFAGTQGLVQRSSMSERFFAAVGATRLQRTICGSTAAAGVTAALGTASGVLPEDVVHSRFVILWGTNTAVTNQHLWVHVRTAKERGATIVVVDPVRTRTASAADWHVAPVPGTDAALALAMANVILAEGLHDADYLERHTTGLDVLRQRAAAWPPERAAAVTGVPADEIARLARAYATTRPSLVRVLIGMEHRERGGSAIHTVACLPALVGAWRDRGGGLAGMTTAPFRAALRRDRLAMPELAPDGTRSVNMIELGRALTDPDLDPPVKALVVHGSNPALTTPNSPLVRQGLAREDLFTVVHEQFVTDTAKFADVVLPATTEVEHLDLLDSWGHVDLMLNRPAVPPPGDALAVTEVFRRLAKRMGLDHPCFDDTDEDLVRQALDSDHPLLDGITYEVLAERGWARLRLPEDHRPFADGGFPTPSGRCNLAVPDYEPADEGPAGDAALRERFPLILLTAKSLRFLNSGYANAVRASTADRGPVADLHVDDAAARGIADGDRVRVFNDRGSIVVPAKVGDRVRRGVVAVPFGWWSDPATGASVNSLTTDRVADLGGGGAYLDTLVEVEPAPG